MLLNHKYGGYHKTLTFLGIENNFSSLDVRDVAYLWGNKHPLILT